jgi:hypothetical protein
MSKKKNFYFAKTIKNIKSYYNGKNQVNLVSYFLLYLFQIIALINHYICDIFLFLMLLWCTWTVNKSTIDDEFRIACIISSKIISEGKLSMSKWSFDTLGNPWQSSIFGKYCFNFSNISLFWPLKLAGWQ